MEPITTALAALGAVKQIVGLIQEACSTVDDISSLGPMLGKYFNKKHEVIKNYEEAKKTNFQGSNMAKALEIELELDRMAQFEKKVQMLFFQANKMDVWQKIVARAAAMDEDAKVAKRREEIALANKKRKEKEQIELFIILLVVFIFLALSGYSIYEAYTYCQAYRCGY